jgi:hypothetical protein
VVGAVAALVLMGALLGSCASRAIMGADEVAKYNASPLTVPVPPGLSDADVEAVMVSTLEERKWTVVERSPKQVAGTLRHRDFDAKAILKVEGKQVKILSDSRYKSPTTGEVAPAVPHAWLKNIEEDLQVFLSRRAGLK